MVRVRLPNAVWHSRNKVPGQKLVVRLHRFELFGEHIHEVRWENVDILVVVSDFFKAEMMRLFDIHPERIRVLPQFVDVEELNRPKTPEAARTIGLVGINPFGHKRPDRAIDLLERVLDRRPNVRLRIRSRMPWEVDWIWRDAEARSRYVEWFARIHNDERLRAAVMFDPPGADMERWYTGVGIILSTSDSEGCHTSVMEGMASGSLPLVYSWPGARSLFPKSCVFDEIEEATDLLVAQAESKDGDAAKAWANEQHWDISSFVDFVNEVLDQ